MSLRIIGVKLLAEVSGFVAPLARATGGVRAFTTELDKAAKAGKLDAVSQQATRMGLSLVAAFASVEMAAARFEQQMSKVDAVANTNAQGMKRLADAALQAGRTTKYSAIEAAKAEEELAKAGISTADILGGALRGALSLAAAGDIELAEAADVAAKAMNIFKLSGGDVTHIADVLSAGANKSATDVHELAMALKMGGLAAGAAGMSLEETVGTLAAFAQSALVGSDSGTSLKSMLLFLQTPTEKATELMKRLGIEVYDAQGNFIGTAKLAGVLQEKLGGLTQEQRNAALATIFGADAMRAANVLYKTGEKGIRDWIAAVDDQGAAAAAADKKTNNLMGDIKRLKGALETMAIESGSGANGGLRVLTQGLTALTNQFERLPPVVSGGIVILLGITGVTLLLSAGLIKVRNASAEAVAQLAAMGPAGAKAAAALSVASRWAGKAAVAFAALQILGAIFHEDLKPQIDGVADSLEKLAKTGKLAGEGVRLFGEDFEDLKRGLVGATNTGFMKGFDDFSEAVVGIFGIDAFGDARQRVEAFDQGLAKLVNTGHAEAAASVLKQLSKETGRSVADLTKALPGYAQALAEADKAAEGFAAQQQAAAANAKVLQSGLAGLVKETGSLVNAWKQLHGVQISWAEAQINVEQAFDDLTEALHENGKALDFDSEKGRDNEKAILAYVKAGIEAAQGKYDLVAATDGEAAALVQATAVYSGYIERLRAALSAQGLTKAQVDTLISSYASIPPIKTTTVTTPGLDDAILRMQTFKGLVNSATSAVMAGVNIGIFNATNNRQRRWGGITEHARDGLLRDAKIYSAVNSGARYAFAEPATGGEAFVPKRGNRDRSLGILGTAAGWYGHTLAPMGGTVGGGGVQTVIHKHEYTGSITLSGREMVSGFRREVKLSGGSVQNYAGPRAG